MQFTEEALRLLLTTAQQAITPIEVETGDVRSKTWLSGSDLIHEPVPPAVRKSEVYSLDDLIAVAKSSMVVNPVIWHSPLRVVLVLDDTDRRDVVQFNLQFSRPFEQMIALDKGVIWQDQRAFVFMLRTTLQVDSCRVAPFRRLDWEQIKASVGDIQPGKDRLGSSIQASAKGAGELPEDMLFSVPIYDNQAERQTYSIRCAVEINPFELKLALIPFTGEISLTIDAAQQSLRERLEAALGDIPVYYGVP